jgi:hypothetical protein
VLQEQRRQDHSIVKKITEKISNWLKSALYLLLYSCTDSRRISTIFRMMIMIKMNSNVRSIIPPFSVGSRIR